MLQKSNHRFFFYYLFFCILSEHRNLLPLAATFCIIIYRKLWNKVQNQTKYTQNNFKKSPRKDVWLSLFSVKLQASPKHRIVSRVFWNATVKWISTNNTKTIENLEIFLHVNILAPAIAAPIVILIGSTQWNFLINSIKNNARDNNQRFNCISFIFLL